MKSILIGGRRYVLRFQKGEEVFSELKKFLAEQGITASVFNGIGACNMAELAVYDVSAKDYRTRVFNENLEILSIIGNSAMLNGAVALHAHAVLSRPDFSALGGHVIRLIISATCEIFLTRLNGTIERRLDPETNLNLLS